SGKARFDAPRGVVGLEQEYRFAERDRGVIIIKNVKVSQTGVYRIGVSLEGVQALSTLSNPIICQDEPAERVFWGDLHAHGWGDSSMFLMHDNTDKLRPSSRHDQARRIGRYDYAAPSAMSMPDSGEREEIWNAYQEAYQENDEPGRYVPFMAMEMHPGETGDRVLIFYENAELPFSCREDVQRVYREFARREDTILETHIGGAPPYFEEFKPEEEELVEVTSAFANAEWLLQKMLSSGFHPGITGASDLHLGLLGAPRAVETFRGRFGFADRRLNVRDSGFGSGPLGAIAAERCTREALWKSLKSRNGYATTGDRIYLNLNAGGHRMGEAANLPDRFPLTLSICGQDRIERVDLVVGDRLAESFYPDKMDVRIEMDFDRTRLPPGHWFYFRIKQSNAEYAWTAPVWLPRQEGLADRSRTWPAWNHTEPQAPAPILRSGPAGEPDAAAALQRYRKDLEDYLEVEGDRGAFGEILPVGIAEESMGTCARFISRTTRENFPVTIRWFFEYEIPKLRIDWGYESFGVVDCHRGP
ncbi:MAG TPA: DUF3604 domain-containing protein, partial [Spirochaetia bacterium]|nr:DUF3604 domain-containing protein [Spirochaetia bacterium]